MNPENIIATRPNKVVYREGDRCIKVFNADFSKADILNEALNQARIEETGLHIPKILGVTMIDGQWAIITEFIEGTTLDKLMADNPDKLDDYLNLLVDVQLDIHSRTAPQLHKLKDKMNRKISDSRLDATTRYDLHTRLEAMPKHKKVCHGDLNPSNIVISPDGTPYILDWAHATQGNASADTALTYLQFCMNGQFDTAKKYLDLFCMKSDTAKQYVQKWMPIVAASQLAKSNELEHKFLLSWVNVVDYQ
ncbi:MAG: phosphotransferase family protein [Faecousia sp.]